MIWFSGFMWRKCIENILVVNWMNNCIISAVVVTLNKIFGAVLSVTDVLNKRWCNVSVWILAWLVCVSVTFLMFAVLIKKKHACLLFFPLLGFVTALWSSTRTESSSWKTTTSLPSQMAGCPSTGSNGEQEIIQREPFRRCRWSCSRSWRVRQNNASTRTQSTKLYSGRVNGLLFFIFFNWSESI